jgi:hypothetical protein
MFVKAVLFTALLAIAQAAPVAHKMSNDGLAHQATKRTNVGLDSLNHFILTNADSDLPSTTEL